MAHPLDSIGLKLARAQKHLNATRDILQPFNNGEVEILREQDQDKPNYYSVRLILPTPDPNLSVIIGDCLHNLRSSLDHLVHQLIQLNGGRTTTSSQFPICDTADGFKRQLMRNRLCGMANRDQRMIETFQPYMLNAGNPRGELLWILSELMNTDKHRALNTTAVLATDITTVFGGHLRGHQGIAQHGGVWVSSPFVPYRSGDIIFGGTQGATGGMHDLHGHATMPVVFQEPAAMDRRVIETLQQMLDFIKDRIIHSFEKRF